MAGSAQSAAKAQRRNCGTVEFTFHKHNLVCAPHGRESSKKLKIFINRVDFFSAVAFPEVAAVVFDK
ncbi:MAG: hypothetical protein LBB38_04455 [Puniceicoccales bacterium]|jgi:hypothetical protein|nr:hypothetical protein [Puniceicoccales bacterium]